MDDLYTQFLKNNDLDLSLFTRGYVEEKKKMVIPEKLLGLKIKGIPVHLNTSIKNGRLLLLEIEMSKVEAEKNLRMWFKAFNGATLDPDDANRLVEFLYQDVLTKLLWPLEYVTKEGQLNVDEFVPMARMMEAMLDEFVGAIENFLYALDENELILEDRVNRRREELNASTRAWVDNAPLELRATGRVREGLFGGKYLDIQGTVRSTLSSGQINAQYMADNLVANMGVSRDRYQTHMELLKYLKDVMENIIKNYRKNWNECLKNEIKKIRTIYWPYIYSEKDAVLNRPDQSECFDYLYDRLDDPSDFPKMVKYIKYYNFDFEEIIGKGIYAAFINHYYHEKEYIDDDIDALFYMHYYGKKTLASCPVFFNRFINSVKRISKNTCELTYQQYPNDYVEKKDLVMANLIKMIEDFPGITELQKAPLIEVVWYNYYDVLKDYKNRDKYDPSGKEKEIPVFIYD